MSKINLEVKGMTCGHCVMSVKEELAEINGVDSVSVDLNSDKEKNSTVTITTLRDVSDDALNDAIGEAGFELVNIQR